LGAELAGPVPGSEDAVFLQGLGRVHYSREHWTKRPLWGHPPAPKKLRYKYGEHPRKKWMPQKRFKALVRNRPWFTRRGVSGR
jgi:hypothetical protein